MKSKRKPTPYWNYRIMVEKCHGEVYFHVHSVYYDIDGIPTGYSADSVRLQGDSKKSIKWDIKQYKRALKKPVLWRGERFPEVYTGKNFNKK